MFEKNKANKIFSLLTLISFLTPVEIKKIFTFLLAFSFNCLEEKKLK